MKISSILKSTNPIEYLIKIIKKKPKSKEATAALQEMSDIMTRMIKTELENVKIKKCNCYLDKNIIN
ncbi:MAG TPA: hypothetical protein VK338_05595 [Candidatus Nitrosocosmicus sp.]|nr:hypothetical protein [Candidatus Nitrosocosmicus sp.]